VPPDVKRQSQRTVLAFADTRFFLRIDLALMTSGSHTSLEYDTLHDSLVHAGVVLALPELHGAICGALCAGGTDAAVRWLEQAFADDIDPESLVPVRDSLQDLVDASFRMLDGETLAFEPLLPNDDAPLPEQVQALAAWCQGFLAALGECAPEIAAGRGKRPRASEARPAADRDAQAEQADIAEILSDFAEISRAGITDEDAADRDQADFALAELKEYTRVSAQLVFDELRARRDAQSHGVH
jgi:uncharacterized protein YgfB (UPF0149 family)